MVGMRKPRRQLTIFVLYPGPAVGMLSVARDCLRQMWAANPFERSNGREKSRQNPGTEPGRCLFVIPLTIYWRISSMNRMCLTIAACAATAALSGAAVGQTGTLDQSSPFSGASFNVDASFLVWQQQVISGLDGQLEGFELEFGQGPVGGEVDIQIRLGDAWVFDAPVWSGVYTRTISTGSERVFFDTTSAGINLSAGDTYVIECFGRDQGVWLNGSYVAPPGEPLYEGDLWLLEAIQGDGGWRHGFNTYMIEGGGGLSLEYSGSCPGAVSADVSGAEPGGRVALLFAASEGSYVIPGGACAGTTLGLSNAGLRIVDTQIADGSGNASFSGNAPVAACGGYIQAIDASDCETSNVEQIN